MLRDLNINRALGINYFINTRTSVSGANDFPIDGKSCLKLILWKIFTEKLFSLTPHCN